VEKGAPGKHKLQVAVLIIELKTCFSPYTGIHFVSIYSENIAGKYLFNEKFPLPLPLNFFFINKLTHVPGS
jgi:hypothetical protein